MVSAQPKHGPCHGASAVPRAAGKAADGMPLPAPRAPTPLLQPVALPAVLGPGYAWARRQRGARWDSFKRTPPYKQ